MGLVETDGNTNDGDKELADQHAQSTVEEDSTSSELLDSVERDRCRADVDQSKDKRDQELVTDGTGRLQEGSRVVEDEVDTSPLLHHLHGSSQDGSSQVGLLVSEPALEAVHPATEPASGRNHLSLVLFVGNDL